MARKKENEPLSFWGTVGANMTAGLITGVAYAALVLLVGVPALSSALTTASTKESSSLPGDTGFSI